MTKLLIIADDLTGAVDLGVQFAPKGIRSYVCVGAACDVITLLGQHDVLVVNSETRHIPPAKAAEVVGRLARAGRAAGATHFYKKTDSTLRGNVGAELDALRQAGGGGPLVFVPAFPKLGRTVIHGFHFVHGVPLHQTAFGEDPLNPMRTNSVVEILGDQTETPLRVVDIESLRSGGSRLSLSGENIQVVDAESDEDLQTILQLLRATGHATPLAGTAAFGELLADLLPFERSKCLRGELPKPLVVINGSLNEVSLRQTAFARSLGFEQFLLSPELLLEEGRAEPLLAEMAAAVNGGGNVILQTVTDRAQAARYVEAAKQLGWPETEIYLRVAGRLASIASHLLDRAGGGLLMIFGGDTFAAMARARRWTGFKPEFEILPGVSCCRTDGAENRYVVSKAGGFGGDSLIGEIGL